MRAGREWQRRAQAEYASAALAADLLHRLFMLGASPDVLIEGHKVVGEELDHAVLCHGIAARLGSEATAVDATTLRISQRDGGELETALAFAIDFFCCSESVARPIFLEMHRGARDAEIRTVLDRIQRDESRHGAFGFFVVDDLLPRVSAVERNRLQVAARASVERVRALYLPRSGSDDEGDVTTADVELGLLPPRTLASIADGELRRRVEPQLRERGLLNDESV